MAFSVITNTGAMAALQSLNATSKNMATTQTRINTGLAVSSTKDDSAAFTIAQSLRSDLGGLKAVSSSLSRAKSVVDVATAGAEQISDLLNQMKAKALQAADVGVDAASRTSINADFKALRDQITTIVNSSDFNGSNLLKNGGDSVAALRSLNDGDAVTAGYQTDSLTVANQDMSLGATGGYVAGTTPGGTAGSVLTFGVDAEIASAADAAAMVDVLSTSHTNVKTVLSTLGSAARAIDSQITFTSKLSDSIESGIGNLVDADLAKESAMLQSLQVKQQLGVQALSIANQAPQAIMRLFQ